MNSNGTRTHAEIVPFVQGDVPIDTIGNIVNQYALRRVCLRGHHQGSLSRLPAERYIGSQLTRAFARDYAFRNFPC
jgi:hypothetical protein